MYFCIFVTYTLCLKQAEDSCLASGAHVKQSGLKPNWILNPLCPSFVGSSIYSEYLDQIRVWIETSSLSTPKGQFFSGRRRQESAFHKSSVSSSSPQVWDNVASTFEKIFQGFLIQPLFLFLRWLDTPLLENLLNTSLWLLRPGVAQFCKGFAVRSGT